MLDYHYFQEVLFFSKWNNLLAQGVQAGWASRSEYYQAILKKSDFALTALERALKEEKQQLDQIEREGKLLMMSMENQPNSIETHFPLVGRFKEEFFRRMEEDQKFFTFDINDVNP